MPRRSRAFVVLALVVSSAGCGSSSESTSSTTPTTSPERLKTILHAPDHFAANTSARPAVFSGNDAGKVDFQGTTDYINAALEHADAVWSKWFTDNELARPSVGVRIIEPGESFESTCTDENGLRSFASDYANVFDRPSDPNGTDDGTLILPVETIAKMWTGDIFSQQVSSVQRVGDFAAAAIITHEFGHHVQDELGGQLEIPPPGNPDVELLADCFAGVWAYSVYEDNFLEDGDIDEAVDALSVIGDDVGSHGTGDERQDAFLIGYTGTEEYPVPGVPENCISAFWPHFVEATS